MLNRNRKDKKKKKGCSKHDTFILNHVSKVLRVFRMSKKKNKMYIKEKKDGIIQKKKEEREKILFVIVVVNSLFGRTPQNIS